MSSLSSRAFKSTNHHRMSSNLHTTQNQGGGDKKAGFPYQVGRISWTYIALDACDPAHDHCYLLGCYNTNRGPLANITRPIGSTYTPNTYFHIPGTR